MTFDGKKKDTPPKEKGVNWLFSKTANPCLCLKQMRHQCCKDHIGPVAQNVSKWKESEWPLHVAMESSEMVRFGLQVQATGTWNEATVDTQSQTT